MQSVFQNNMALDEATRQNILMAFQVLNTHLPTILQSLANEEWIKDEEKMGFFAQKIKSWYKENIYIQQYQDIFAQLSKQERKILTLIAEGKSSREIGELLFISEFTVETHRKNIKQKTGLQSTAQITNFAYKFGLLS